MTCATEYSQNKTIFLLGWPVFNDKVIMWNQDYLMNTLASQILDP